MIQVVPFVIPMEGNSIMPGSNIDSIVVAWGDASQIPPHSNPGQPPAPSSALFRYVKHASKQLGTFHPNHPNHALRGQQRMIVLKINENFTSQIPSCWPLGDNPATHPAIPNQVPEHAHRMRKFRGKWSVLECPHCHTKWDRDVNACRYI